MDLVFYNSVIFLPFLTAFIVCAFSVPVVIRLAKKFGIIDDPKLHKHPGIIHLSPVPRAGGISLFVGALVAGLLFLPLTNVTIAIYVASFLALAVGVIDDKFNAQSKDVSPYLRFFVNILCATIVVASGVTVPFITNPFGGILQLDSVSLSLFGIMDLSLADVFAALWIIWVMNMLNWSKGVDGQMPGIVAISAIVIGILNLRFPILDQNSLLDGKLSFIIAGSALGFLVFNFHPAKIFPGYGATSLYLLLAVVSMHSSAKLATAVLVMGVPMVDAIFTIFRRIFSGKSPFWYDNRHLHHILLRLGYRQKQIALSYWIFSAILGTVSLTLQSRSKGFAVLMLVVLVGGALLFLHFIVRDRHEKNSS